MQTMTGGLLVGGPYDGEIFDSEHAAVVLYAMASVPDCGIEWHRYDRLENAYSAADSNRPIFAYRGTDHGESGVTPCWYPWSAVPHDRWQKFARSGRRMVIFGLEEDGVETTR